MQNIDAELIGPKPRYDVDKFVSGFAFVKAPVD